MKIRFFAAALALCLAVVVRGQCTPRFVAGYDYGRLVVTSSSAFDSVFAAAVFDDHSGTGPALFVGGYLSVLGDQGGSWMAKLVGDRWMAIPGLDGPPRCMAVFDDGSGPALYVGGSFSTFPGGTGCLAKWDGTTWTGLGLVRNNTFGSGVCALVRHDDGHGMSLFAAGFGFALPDQPNPSLVMRYDGTTWHSLDAGGWFGTSLYDATAVRTMVVFDDGSGPRLYAGGSFNMTPNGASNCVAVWNGTTWFPSGGGLNSQGVIKCLAVHQGELFAAGDAGGGPGGVWRRSGALWELSFGSNTGLPPLSGATALLSYDDGTGPALYAIVGLDAHTGSQLAIYSNGAWAVHGPQLSNEVGSPRAFMTTLLPAPTSAGTHLVTVGRCTASGVTALPNMGAWVNGAWQAIEPVGNGFASASARVMYDPEADDGAVSTATRRYTAGGWTPTSLPLSNVGAMLRLHQGGVSSLVISNGNQFMANSGAGWQALPSLSNTSCVGVFADAGGESLAAVTLRSIPYSVNKLVGSTWVSMGSPFEGSSLYLSSNRLVTYDSGSGPKLYLGGIVRVASNGAPTSYLAYLDNGQWVQVPGVPGKVLDMRVYDVGSGPELILACTRDGVIGPATGGIYRWNGTRIDAVGTGMVNVEAGTLLPFDDGTGVHLWASCSGSALGSLAFWDGTAWRGYTGVTVNGVVTSMAPALRPDRTHSLMLGGGFRVAGDTLSSGIAELATCPRTCSADFNGDGDSGTDADIESFFACIGGNCCAVCGSTDFNNDGDSGTDADIESFFRVLAGGVC
jgi:hypothetical protein